MSIPYWFSGIKFGWCSGLEIIALVLLNYFTVPLLFQGEEAYNLYVGKTSTLCGLREVTCISKNVDSCHHWLSGI